MAAGLFAAGAAKAGPWLAKLMASPHFWNYLLTGAFVGQTALGQYGEYKGRGLTREQIRIQKLLGTSEAKATKRATEEAREQEERYTKMLLQERGKERTEAREQQLLQSWIASQDRQAMAVMQALQGIMGSRPRYSSAAGITGLMRS